MAGLGRRSHYRKHLTDAVMHDLPEPDNARCERVARIVGTRGGNMFDVVVASASAVPVSDGDGDAAADASTSDEPPPLTAAGDRPPGSGSMSINPPGDGLSSSLSSKEIPQRAHVPQLAFLPTKFRKLVWIKRNDFVIVECGDEDERATETPDPTLGNDTDAGASVGPEPAASKDQSSGLGFRYVINHILYKEQVKHLKCKGLWPSDPFFADSSESASEEADNVRHEEKALTSNMESEKIGENDDGSEGDHAVYGDEQYHGSGYADGGLEEDDGIVYEDPLTDGIMVNTNRISSLRIDDSSSEEESDDE